MSHEQPTHPGRRYQDMMVSTLRSTIGEARRVESTFLRRYTIAILEGLLSMYSERGREPTGRHGRDGT